MYPSSIEKMLNFIYQGEICLSTNELTWFLEVAEELKIEGFAQMEASEDDMVSHTESVENKIKLEDEETLDESEDKEFESDQSKREGTISKSSTKSLLLGAPVK